MDHSTIESAVTELRTLRDMVRWGVSQFNAAKIYFGHGIENAWDEAVFLALHSLHLPPDSDGKIFDARLLTSERRAIAELLTRRINERKPAAYLTQEAWFAGLPFYVDERVIIPRSPIAELIEKNFEPWLEGRFVANHILDLCTGSGCIAIGCALAFPEAMVDAVDISAEALEVAKINVERYQLQDQVHLIQSDLFANLKGKTYDLIVSNPPYVSQVEMAELPAEYRHEPQLALAAGNKGLDVVERIIQEASKFLAPNGALIVEVGNSAAALEEHFPDIPFLWVEFERGGHGVFLLTAEQVRKINKKR